MLALPCIVCFHFMSTERSEVMHWRKGMFEPALISLVVIFFLFFGGFICLPLVYCWGLNPQPTHAKHSFILSLRYIPSLVILFSSSYFHCSLRKPNNYGTLLKKNPGTVIQIALKVQFLIRHLSQERSQIYITLFWPGKHICAREYMHVPP
jgi:heme/copper-type cytochrome/quinol oxidase subunit 3